MYLAFIIKQPAAEYRKKSVTKNSLPDITRTLLKGAALRV
jgi:hypothetical protein